MFRPITLIVTAHRLEHLAEALGSVSAQTTDRFELVFVADSTGKAAVFDAFTAFANAWQRSPVRVLLIKGGSAGVVRNAGFSVSATPWVTYLDGDDILHPSALSIAAEVAMWDCADIFSTGLWHITPVGDVVEVPDSINYAPHIGLYLADPELTGEIPYLFQLTAIKKFVWARYPYYAGGPGGDDLDFILHHMLTARFRKLALPLYGHRRTADGFSDRARRHASRGGSPCPCPCSQRYRQGYYRRLLTPDFRDSFDNFSGDVRIPHEFSE